MKATHSKAAQTPSKHKTKNRRWNERKNDAIREEIINRVEVNMIVRESGNRFGFSKWRGNEIRRQAVKNRFHENETKSLSEVLNENHQKALGRPLHE